MSALSPAHTGAARSIRVWFFIDEPRNREKDIRSPDKYCDFVNTFELAHVSTKGMPHAMIRIGGDDAYQSVYVVAEGTDISGNQKAQRADIVLDSKGRVIKAGDDVARRLPMVYTGQKSSADYMQFRPDRPPTREEIFARQVAAMEANGIY